MSKARHLLLYFPLRLMPFDHVQTHLAKQFCPGGWDTLAPGLHICSVLKHSPHNVVENPGFPLHLTFGFLFPSKVINLIYLLYINTTGGGFPSPCLSRFIFLSSHYTFGSLCDLLTSIRFIIHGR